MQKDQKLIGRQMNAVVCSPFQMEVYVKLVIATPSVYSHNN